MSETMPAGRALDAKVAEKVMGYTFRIPSHGSCCTCQHCGQPYEDCDGCEYSTNMEHAWKMQDKLVVRGLHDAFVECLCAQFGTYDARVVLKATPAQRCRAALAAVGEEP